MVYLIDEFQGKTTFVQDIVGLWAREGGLSCIGRKKGIQWEGMLEEGGNVEIAKLP